MPLQECRMRVMPMMNLVTVIVLLGRVAISEGQELTSTGDHVSGEFVWVVGVNNLCFSFSLTVPTITVSNFYNYVHTWFHITNDNFTLVSFETSFEFNADGSIDGARCYYGTSSSNPSFATAYGIDYKISCDLSGSLFTSQFTIVSSLNGAYNESVVKVTMGASPLTNYVEKLRLKYCDGLTGNDNLKIIGGTNAEYESVANFTCSDSALVVNETYDKNINMYLRTCNYDAKWSKQGTEIDCWFAPKTNVSITQNGLISNGTLVSEEACSIICGISAKGNPTPANVTYYKNGMRISSDTFDVTSSDNGVSVFCQMANSYVNEVDSSVGLSASINLNVLYQPEPQNDVAIEEKYAQLDGNYTIVIKFNANPRVEVSDTAMYFNGNQLDSWKASISYQDTLHTYRYLLTEVSSDSFGTYILFARSPSLALAGRVTNFTVILSSTELISTTTIPESTSFPIETGGLSTAAIAAISTCVGIVLTIIATSAVWWWMLKRMSKGEGSMKHEKKESAYEPTYVDGQPLESAYEVVNRETNEDDLRVASQEQTNDNSAYEVIR